MAITKPIKPASNLPETWGGTQYPYTEEQIGEGYPEAVPTVVDGGSLNYEKRGIFERLNYLTKIADVVNDIPIGKTLTADANNRFEYSSSYYPDQTGNENKFLMTDGNETSWSDIPITTVTYWE